MDRSTYENYRRIQELAVDDLQYQMILEEYRALEPALLELWSRLPETDVDIIMDYLGAFGAAGISLLEIACKEMDFPGAV